jgi:hypothetical protein
VERDEIGRGEQPSILRWDLSHLGDNEYDARLIKFRGWEDTLRLSSAKAYSLPKVVRFDADFRALSKLDYPYNDVRWPIMSARMLDVLTGVGQLRHKLIPVIMVKDTVHPNDRYDEAGRPKTNMENTHFAAVQLLEPLDALDWEKSDAKRDEDLPRRAQEIQHLVLKEPPQGFPPLFRLSAYPTVLLVSASARHALETSAVQGIDFQELDDFRS